MLSNMLVIYLVLVYSFLSYRVNIALHIYVLSNLSLWKIYFKNVYLFLKSSSVNPEKKHR